MTEWQESHESMSVLASAAGVTFLSPLILSPVLRAPTCEMRAPKRMVKQSAKNVFGGKSFSNS